MIITADRIAILTHGKMACYGSIYFLKMHYGIGYNLTLSKLSTAASNEIEEYVMYYLPKAVLKVIYR